MAYIPYNTGQYNPNGQSLTAGQLAPPNIDQQGNLQFTPAVTVATITAADLADNVYKEIKSIRIILGLAFEESNQYLAGELSPDNLLRAEQQQSIRG